jgi:hypothetical protein
VDRARDGDAQPDRTRQLVIDVDTENPDIVLIVDRIAELFGKVRRDRAFAQVGIVAEPVDRRALFRRVGPPVVHTLQQPLDPVIQARG